MEETVTEVPNQGSPITENKMNNEETNKLAINLVDDIKRLHSRLEEVQDSCLHKETQIEFINGTLQKSCKYCYKVVGYATQDEAKASGYIN